MILTIISKDPNHSHIYIMKFISNDPNIRIILTNHYLLVVDLPL